MNCLLIYGMKITKNRYKDNMYLLNKMFKDKEMLCNLYNDPNYLKLHRVTDYITPENAIFILTDIDTQLVTMLNIPKISDLDMNKSELSWYAMNLDAYKNSCGIVTKQQLEIQGISNHGKLLVGDFIERKICDILSNDQVFDGVTNLEIEFKNPDGVEFKSPDIPDFNSIASECVLKINGFVICSSLVVKNSKIKLVNFPNVIWVTKAYELPKIEIYIRQNGKISYCLHNYVITYDLIYLEYNSRGKIIGQPQYMFETADGDLIFSREGKYVIRYYTYFFDHINPEFKMFYDHTFMLNKSDDNKIEISI